MTLAADFREPPPQWSPEVRTWVSLLLFVHLFAVVVAVTTYTRPSLVQEQLHELFAPYLRNLHLTAYPNSYPFARFYLTHALPTDAEYSCQIEFQAPDGKTETVVIPSSGLQPRVRYRRYQALANATGTLAENESNEDFSSILPRAIAGSILKRRGASQGVLRCKAHDSPEMESMAELESGRRGPLEIYRDVYEAQVFVTSSGVELLKKSTRLEVAPVEGAKKPPSKPQP